MERETWEKLDDRQLIDQVHFQIKQVTQALEPIQANDLTILNAQRQLCEALNMLNFFAQNRLLKPLE